MSSYEDSDEESYKEVNAELMKSADQNKINSAISQQIALLGSREMYERTNRNFKERRFEALFAKVTLKN